MSRRSSGGRLLNRRHFSNNDSLLSSLAYRGLPRGEFAPDCDAVRKLAAKTGRRKPPCGIVASPECRGNAILNSWHVARVGRLRGNIDGVQVEDYPVRCGWHAPVLGDRVTAGQLVFAAGVGEPGRGEHSNTSHDPLRARIGESRWHAPNLLRTPRAAQPKTLRKNRRVVQPLTSRTIDGP